MRVGDGTLGVPELAPFDAIAVAAAAPGFPQTLYEQLRPRGRLVVPVGGPRVQRLELIVRSPEGPAVVHSVPCRFVPLVGEEGFADDRAAAEAAPVRSPADGLLSSHRPHPRRPGASPPAQLGAARRSSRPSALSGYVINLVVYTALLKGAGFHYAAAATCSFLVAVTNNYTWNRLWTFHAERGHVGWQGLRFLVVALVAYIANLALLTGFIALGLDKVLAQAIAVVLVVPLNFLGNKLWSFRR